MSHHTQARTAEVNREDQGRDNSHIVQEVPVVLKVVVSSISRLSEVGMTPESLWHQFDVITPIPLDWAFFEMLVTCKPKAICLSHIPTHSGWSGSQSLTVFRSGGARKCCLQSLISCLPKHNSVGYPHNALSFICCYHWLTHIPLSVPQTWLMKWKHPRLQVEHAQHS